MNEVTSNAEFSPQPSITLDQARIQVLDSFFELEVALGRWARILGHRDANAPFGQRLKAVSEDANLPNHASSGQVKYIRCLPEKLGDVLKVRNAIVHSRTSIGTFQGKSVIFFETSPLIFAGEGAVIPMEIEFITKNAVAAKSIASHLCNYLKQNITAAEKSEEHEGLA